MGFELKALFVIRIQNINDAASFTSKLRYITSKLASRLKIFQTDRQADRQTGRQADRQTGRQADRQTGRQADRQTGRQADRQTGRQADRQTGRQADRQTGRQADRQTDTFYWDFARVRSTIGFVREFWQMRIDLLITNKQ